MYENYCGRKFRFGVTDCYTMVRDFYKREFGIELRNYARYDKFWEDESFEITPEWLFDDMDDLM